MQKLDKALVRHVRLQELLGVLDSRRFPSKFAATERDVELNTLIIEEFASAAGMTLHQVLGRRLEEIRERLHRLENTPVDIDLIDDDGDEVLLDQPEPVLLDQPEPVRLIPDQPPSESVESPDYMYY